MRSFQRSRGLARNYRSVSKASCTARRSRASLCAGLAAEDQEVLDLATNPQQFSWHDGWEGSLPNPFGPVGDQIPAGRGLFQACVFDRGEGAVARALGLPGGSVSISEQDMGFCPEQPDNLKFCGTSWDFTSAVNKFSSRQGKFVQKKCLPYTVTTVDDQGSTCRYKCRDVDPNISKGVFKARKIRSMAAAQRQIRSHGGVMTRLNVYKDFRKFFESNPTGVYGGELCSKGAAEDLEQEHAVVLVGYDNYNQFWIARNSWGSKFADKRYFRIKYGVCGVAGPDDTYGLIFEPNQRPKFKFTLSPDPDGNPGCYVYRARGGDSLGMLAEVWGVPVDELVANNSATVQDLDEGLQGKFLTDCPPDWLGVVTKSINLNHGKSYYLPRFFHAPGLQSIWALQHQQGQAPKAPYLPHDLHLPDPLQSLHQLPPRGSQHRLLKGQQHQGQQCPQVRPPVVVSSTLVVERLGKHRQQE
eukprot:gene9525-9689_t